ncbi:hypothetical protein QE250_03800 [Chromatiaceae bacterium AAb-1]|nr:hypothetical protein [Chromatiaceae bacterium AAb-1]
MKTLTCTAFAALLLAASPITTGHAAEAINPALNKNAEILRTILQTALKDDQTIGLSQLNYSYLAGQGILFQATLSGFRSRIITNQYRLPAAMPAPEPINTEVGSFSFSFNTGDIEALAEQAAEFAEQQQEKYAELRKMQQQRRDLERDLRDLERDKRNIEFNRKLTDLSKEQQQELQQLTQKTQQLTQQLENLTKAADTAKAAFEKKQAAEAAETARQTAAQISKTGEQFAVLLCDYGASLRELPDNEYVSLQLSTSSRSAEKYYWVVKKSDINQCITGKINAKALQAKTRHYQF